MDYEEEINKQFDSASLEEQKPDQEKPESEALEQEPPEENRREEQMQQLENELQKYKEKHLQQLAEMENLRKRLQKEKSDMTRFAIENALSEFLAPLDSFEGALKFADQMGDEVKNWATGFQMILTQLKDVLENHHVRAFKSVGEIFDPYYHEAIEVEETDEHPEGFILQELMKGYMCGSRVLRPARVKVAKKVNNKEKK